MSLEENEPPKWFAKSVAMWATVLTGLPTVLASFGVTMADPWVQRMIQVVSLLMAVASLVWTTTGDKKVLLPPPKNDGEA